MEKSTKRVLIGRKTKEASNKENEANKVTKNLMCDPRVFRGNTFALKSTAPPWPTLDLIKARLTIEKAAEKKLTQADRASKNVSGKLKMYEKQMKDLARDSKCDTRRKSCTDTLIQTETYLEEIFDRPDESAQECQTDPLQDRPSTPLFIPKKSGIDNETQILPGELFDFDTECQPIIESLLGKVLEQSLLELLEDYELQQIEIQKNSHLERKQIEMVELQRLDAEEERKNKEIEARLEEERLKKEKETQEQYELAISIFSKKVADKIVPSVLFDLKNSGFFVDPIKKEIEIDYRKSLISKIREKYEEEEQIRQIALEIINKSLESEDMGDNSY